MITRRAGSRNLHLAVYSITLITGCPTNLLAFYAFYQKLRGKANPSIIFLINLTVSDLAFLAFLPFKLVDASFEEWKLPAFLCPLSGFFYYSTIYCSTLFLTAVSVERYLGVAFPIQYKMYRKPVYAVTVSIFLWICAFAHSSIVYVTEYHRGENSSNFVVCYDNFTDEQLEILLPFRLELGIVLYCIPSLITCFCYGSFIKILISTENIGKEKKHRAIGLVLATLTVFIVCFTPYNVSHIVGFIQKSSPTWRSEALLLSTFNASLDPIIFYFSSSAVQKSIKRCLHGIASVLCARRPLQMLSKLLSKRRDIITNQSANNSQMQCSRL
ncbi:free fatty acid receptor 2-like [Protopterus annectens]|uniref:free fatty acid receptor 2-like n=1 Tax=Protopterus annectens TaxID=7888 RepID=UPI001CF9A749|nr:free fatty acid receptor 2-like [Protopterus annectens]